MEQYLVPTIIGGATALVGKILWDWLKNRNRGEYITVEILKNYMTELKEDIKKDFDLLLQKIDNKYVPWTKYDALAQRVEELEKSIAVMAANCDQHHKGD
jgi:hypothetical protein